MLNDKTLEEIFRSTDAKEGPFNYNRKFYVVFARAVARAAYEDAAKVAFAACAGYQNAVLVRDAILALASVMGEEQ
jgi:hypothetical protein